MTMTVTIERWGNPNFERKVAVYKNGAGRKEVDPQQEIFRAIGVSFSRESCVLDFAEGARRAGATVVMLRRNTWGGKGRDHSYVVGYKPEVGLAYFLYGFLYTKGLWEQFVAALHKSVQPTERLNALYATAQYYLDRSWESKLSIQIPIN